MKFSKRKRQQAPVVVKWSNWLNVTDRTYIQSSSKFFLRRSPFPNLVNQLFPRCTCEIHVGNIPSGVWRLLGVIFIDFVSSVFYTLPALVFVAVFLFVCPLLLFQNLLYASIITRGVVLLVFLCSCFEPSILLISCFPLFPHVLSGFLSLFPTSSTLPLSCVEAHVFPHSLPVPSGSGNDPDGTGNKLFFFHLCTLILAFYHTCFVWSFPPFWGVLLACLLALANP